MYYVKIKDEVLQEFCEGDVLPDNAVEVSADWNGNIGESASFYDEHLNRKSEAQLTKEGLIELPAGFKLNDDETEIVQMTDVELYGAGLKEIPSGFILDNDELREMTTEEKLEAGLLTQSQLDAEEIAELKSYLDSTDYVTIKIMEGVATAEEYAEVLAKRQEARTRINELEKKHLD